MSWGTIRIWGTIGITYGSWGTIRMWDTVNRINTVCCGFLTACGGILASSGGMISFRHPTGQAALDVGQAAWDCAWLFTAPPGQQILVNFITEVHN